MESMKQRNTTIDGLKLIFSICIIGIHLDLFRDFSFFLYRPLTEGLFRIGVPFYFITSGYFFADKLNERKRSNAYLFRLLKIYLIFEVLDIALNLLVPGIHYPFAYIILRIFTTGLNRIYWYLVSLILTCLICRGLWQKGYVRHLILAGFILYLITMTYDSYSFLFENTFFAQIGEAHKTVWAWPQGGFGESVLFLSLGIALKQKDPVIHNRNLWLSISMICLLIESWICQSNGAADANCYFSLIPASVLLFSFALDHPHFLNIPKAGAVSLYVYMIHMYFSYVSYVFSTLSFPRFIVTSLCSLAAAYLIVHLRKGISHV